MTEAQKQRFRKTVLDFYKQEGRHTLPWRVGDNGISKSEQAYRILVSEAMLQQTQVARVVPYYLRWFLKFGTKEVLANASLAEVLILWQGLGYNKRAKALWETAKIICNERGGVIPTTRIELLKLPGIGRYTAGAICVFAYNQKEVLVETNIRTVVIYHFFTEISRSSKKTQGASSEKIGDEAIETILKEVQPHKNFREWNWALMDYGAYLKREGNRTNELVKGYAKQSAFKGSSREVRGAIIRALSKVPCTKETLKRQFKKERYPQVLFQLQKLQAEGLIAIQGKTYKLP